MLTLKELTPVRLLKNKLFEDLEQMKAANASLNELANHLGHGRAKLGMLEGNMDEGELEIGQVAALIDDVPTAAEVLHRMVQEYAATRAAITAGGGRWGA